MDKLQDLRNRLCLAKLAITILEKEPDASDVLKHYQAQKDTLEKLIEVEEAKPHDVVIKLKTAKLTVRKE
jgi:hypothetical protein